MINRVIICCLILLNSATSFSQMKGNDHRRNYHFIYLDISQNKDRERLTNSVLGLLEEIIADDSHFLIFCSNGYLPKVFNAYEDFTNTERENLISYLQISNPSPPIVQFDKDSVLRIWDYHDIIEIGNENRTFLKYDNLYLHYFISSDLFNLEEKELIDRLLLVKDLTKRHIDPKKIFIELFFRTDDTDEFIKRQNQLKVSNPAGYNYSFQSY